MAKACQPMTSTFPIQPNRCRIFRVPVVFADHPAWTRWLVTDQRFVDGRPDVLTYSTPVLTEPVHISGAAGRKPRRFHQRHGQRLGSSS